MATASTVTVGAPAQASFIDHLNSDRHEVALQAFMVIVLAHWMEHLFQGFQIYALGWPVPQSLGLLGYFFPWAIRSETLHYGYAAVMLAGIWMLRKGFNGRKDHFWWMVAFGIQFFHHIEHFALQSQAIMGHNLMGRPVPTSFVQLWVPRVELHLFYNTLVFIPMVIAMYYHMFPPEGETVTPTCSCSKYAPEHDRHALATA